MRPRGVALTVKRLVTRLLGAGTGVPGGPATGGAADEPSARLYECPDCGAVYLSTELESCAACGIGVESVPTERDLRYASPGDG